MILCYNDTHDTLIVLNYTFSQIMIICFIIALETHTMHQKETVKTLERLHKFLRKSDIQEQTEEPQGLRVSLLPHQLIGLAWLEKREKEKPAGGILGICLFFIFNMKTLFCIWII